MRVTKEDLIQFNLFENLPEPFKTLEGDDKFVFIYDVDEENVKLKIYEYDIKRQINIKLFKGIHEYQRKYNSITLTIGFFSITFESRDGLFYQFLRSYNDVEQVDKFIRFCIEQDKMINVSISTNSITSIYSSDDFRRSISYFSPARLQTIMLIYDMIDSTFKNRLSRGLYGDYIKKVVNLIKFDGGVLPEINGRLRFMVIGENANLSEEQIERLKEAKILLRSLQPLDEIYQLTGWAFSDLDGKWRTNIADNEAKISNVYLSEYQGRNLFVPQGLNQQQVLKILANPDSLYGLNYNGKLSQVVEHPTLYKYYPKLNLTPLLYFYGDNSRLGNSFYFSENSRGGFIVINGSKESGDSLSIMLHEIQHYIQRVEGFAQGGNEFFAQFVAAIGGAETRKIFSSINKMQRLFKENLLYEEERLNLIQILKDSNINNSQANQLKEIILKNLKDKEEFQNNYKTINFYLVLFVAENGDISTNNIVIYLQEKFGDFVFELFDNIESAYSKAKDYKNILRSEFKEEDIQKILFKSYENLYGELESRSTQSSRLVCSEFKNYFYITKWEHSPISNITVINGVEEYIDSKEVKAAVEDKDGEYILHFSKDNTCLPFLHELGHIVYDALCELGYKEKIDKSFEKDYNYPNVQEFFVDKFLGYLKDRVDDINLKLDFKLIFAIRSDEEVNEVLDDFFKDKEVSERLKYLQTLLSII